MVTGVVGAAPQPRQAAAEVRLRLTGSPLRHPALPGDRRRRGLSGIYYHHPADHTLVRVGDHPHAGHAPGLKLHFLGKRRAIEPVYKNNIVEVLEFEAGHMLGVLEEVLPRLGLEVRPDGFTPAAKSRLDVAEEDHYLGTFAVAPRRGGTRPEEVELFVQAQVSGSTGCPAGCTGTGKARWNRSGNRWWTGAIGIAIDQGVFDRSSFGVSAVSRAIDAWRHYIVLGTLLHRLQRVPGIGLMSSGYSSRSGHPLPASLRLDDLLTRAAYPPPALVLLRGRSHLGGAGRARGHERGRRAHQGAGGDDPRRRRPVPPRLHGPRARGRRGPAAGHRQRQDRPRATALLPEVATSGNTAARVEPETPTERWLAAEWGRLLGYEEAAPPRTSSSPRAATPCTPSALVNRVGSRKFGTRLPLQTVFDTPMLADLGGAGRDSPST
ncbi:Amino acid adenylation domain-containing protein OS=Streptomyces microflavus OX=1919 GN=G3I39_06080 PE=4 SV=1 [Streptomyces microflavus]